MSSKKIYVVFKGRRPGIYESWSECDPQVSNMPEAEFNIYGSLEEAEKAYSTFNAVSDSKKSDKENLSNPLRSNKNKIFDISIPYYWQQFGTCVMVHMIVPFIPIGFELLFLGHIRTSTLTITAAVYSIALGVSSESQLQFFFAFLVSMVYCGFYGVTVFYNSSNSENSPVHPLFTESIIKNITAIGLILVFLVHLVERFQRHVRARKPFVYFNQNS